MQVIGSPIGSPTPSRRASPSPTRHHHKSASSSRKSSAASRRSKKSASYNNSTSAYLTEIEQEPAVDMEVAEEVRQPITPPATPETGSERHQGDGSDSGRGRRFSDGALSVVSPIPEEKPIDIVVPSMEENVSSEEETTVPERSGSRIGYAKFARLGLAKRPVQYKPRMRRKGFSYGKVVDAGNPEPQPSHVYVTTVPKEGGKIKTPFYTEVEVPADALPADSLIKFETQDFSSTQLDLKRDDKLCSYIIDINLNPDAYSLCKEATVRMRILEECVNKNDDVIILSSRHFQWSRTPTTIEEKEVDGSKRYYAVTKVQCLGKFAVITSKHVDRFVMTTAGGLFSSTINSDVTLEVDEGSLPHICHTVEMGIENTRNEAIVQTSRKLPNIEDVEGTLIASSPIISLNKEVMGLSGLLQDGRTLPAPAMLTIPISTVIPREDALIIDDTIIKVMQRVPMYTPHPDTGKNCVITAGKWTDITAEQENHIDPSVVKDGGKLNILATVPCEYMVLAFDKSQVSDNGHHSASLRDVCESIMSRNLQQDVALMVHQKTEQPSVISVHAVPAVSASIISNAMQEKGEWRPVEGTFAVKPRVRMLERELLDLSFKQGLKLTVNQQKPQIQFNSRRWQGYQFQIEANEDAYSASDDTVSGSIQFITSTTKKVVHTVNISMEKTASKPYKPTVIIKPTPRVSVVREYKQKWLALLSDAEKEKYSGVNQP